MRNKILTTAKELFSHQGYKKTTIRQIVDRSGVLIGSIYYFFKNKEEIFQSIILDVFYTGDNLVVERFGEDVSPVFRYAILCVLELEAVQINEHICELYYEAYSSNSILGNLVCGAAKRSQILFQSYNPTFTYEDYYVRTLVIKGAMRSLIASRYLKQEVPLKKMINTFLEVSLQAFNVKPMEIEQVKVQIAQMENEIVDMVIQLGAESLS